MKKIVLPLLIASVCSAAFAGGDTEDYNACLEAIKYEYKDVAKTRISRMKRDEIKIIVWDLTGKHIVYCDRSTKEVHE